MVKRNDNPKLKIIVMSASLDVNRFRAYFDNCPMIEVSGRTNEVKELFLEDFVDSLGTVNDDLNALRKHFNNLDLNFVGMRSNYNSSYGSEKSRKILEMETNEKLLLEPIVRLIYKVRLITIQNCRYKK